MKIKYNPLNVSWIPVLLWTAVYLLFPSHNNTGDALMYAADIREGVDLFYPHHLLYNGLGYLLAKLFNITDTLALLCALNALAAGTCLALTREILKNRMPPKKLAACLVLLGGCWGVARFATEGETYIIPLVFSLLGSLAYVRKKNPLRISFYAAIACLFHQIHFFWWLGLGIGVCVAEYKKTDAKAGLGKTILSYVCGALVVPLVYILVYLVIPNDSPSIFGYIFHDYLYADNVGFFFKQALILTPISLIRTFFQVHGYIPALLVRCPWLGIGPLLTLACLVPVLMKDRKNNRSESVSPFFAQTHLLIAVLQLFFAFLSNGNAEFMVMIPFAALFFVMDRYDVSLRKITWAAVGVASWNLCLGLVPYRFMEIEPYQAIERHMSTHAESIYVIDNHALMHNKLHYHNPSLCENLNKDYPDTASFYTDKYGATPFFSRASITQKSSEKEEDIILLHADTLCFDLGKVILTECRRSEP